MSKSDLVAVIAKATGCSKSKANQALAAVLDGITGSLKKGQRVALIGFGTFVVRKRAARTGRNPQTGKPIKIKAAKVAAFKAGASLKKAVNK